ncbi:uncharacterized protein HaLaN_11399, partial [Haematococcus lacustris]
MGSKTVPNKYGMLMDHTYLDPRPKPGSAELRKGSTGEPTDRDHGLNMKATIGRSGKLNDGTFTKFIPLLDGDPYEDPLKTKLKADAEKKKKNLTEVPFKTASPMKQSACPGDFYGTNEKAAMGSKTVPNKYGMLMDHTYLDPRPKPGSAELRKGSTGEPTDRDHGLNMKATIGRSGK